MKIERFRGEPLSVWFSNEPTSGEGIILELRMLAVYKSHIRSLWKHLQRDMHDKLIIRLYLGIEFKVSRTI